MTSTYQASNDWAWDQELSHTPKQKKKHETTSNLEHKTVICKVIVNLDLLFLVLSSWSVVFSDVASWEIPEENGGFDGKIIYKWVSFHCHVAQLLLSFGKANI
jgi:tRNA G37 N-methylase Trm5